MKSFTTVFDIWSFLNGLILTIGQRMWNSTSLDSSIELTLASTLGFEQHYSQFWPRRAGWKRGTSTQRYGDCKVLA